MRTLVQSEINEIMHLYTCKRYSINKLRKMFKLQFNDIKSLLINKGISVRSQRDSRLTYKYNEDYFSNIDTEEKAYWLGFIYADGFITKKTNGSHVFGITLAEREPLDKLNKCMDSNKPIGVYKKASSYSNKSVEYKLAFTSNKLVSDLEKWGCVERKTFKLKFPDFLEDSLIPHFIRGYFDGDGSVFYHIQKTLKKEYLMLGVTICGIKSFLIDLEKHINESNTIYKDKRKTTDCYSIKLNSNIRALKLYHYLYKDATMYLSRKKEKFESFIKDRGSTTIIGIPHHNDAEYKELCYIEE